ncbi:MAG: hydroxysqualene dehydroxylase HpnE [Acetobacterales bacterium]
MTHLHIVGAGLAGLACAVEARSLGARVTLYEASARAGGRCRSVDDPRLQRRIDNGNHLLLGGNDHALAYLERIGGRDEMREMVPAAYPFLDLRDGRRWTLRSGLTLGRGRHGSGIGWRDALALLRLLLPRPDQPVARFLPKASLETLWRPLVTAVLNAPPEEASAGLIRAVLWRLLPGGETALRPILARRGLSDAFVDPAVRWLASHGAAVRFGTRVDALPRRGNTVASVNFGDDAGLLGWDDAVVLALPPDAAARLAPEHVPTFEFRPILNAHFATPPEVTLPDNLPFLGLTGGTAEWLFHRPGLVSATVSAASRWIDRPAAEIVDALWRDVSAACGTTVTRPPCRVIKERRATILQDVRGAARRPQPRTSLSNLFLAGDWTATGLPATIEGAVLSGMRAARLALP